MLERNIPKQERYKLKRLLGKTFKAVKEYGLIDKGDRILVGVSGGKDSLILLDVLSKLLKKSDVKFEIVAVHISVSNIPYAIDKEYIQNLCDSLSIPFVFRVIDVDFDNEALNKKKKSNCFVCSWYRRTELFKICEEFKCNKLALGHHMDDVVQTLLLNMAFQGSISTMPPSLDVFDGGIKIIRPLVFVPEKEMIEYQQLKQFVLQKKNCPFEEQSNRKKMKDIIAQLEDIYPHARNNMYNSMSNVMEEYLPKKISDTKLSATKDSN